MNCIIFFKFVTPLQMKNETNHTEQLNTTKKAQNKSENCSPSTTASIHTQGYLGAMNTCPSDSKLFGSSDSKSATERGRLSGKSSGQEQWGVVGKQQLFFRGVGTQEGVYHSNTEVSWEH